MKSKNIEITTTPHKPFQFNQERRAMLSEYFEGPELDTTIRNLCTVLIHCVSDEQHIPAIYPEVHTLTGILTTAIHFANDNDRLKAIQAHRRTKR